MFECAQSWNNHILQNCHFLATDDSIQDNTVYRNYQCNLLIPTEQQQAESVNYKNQTNKIHVICGGIVLKLLFHIGDCVTIYTTKISFSECIKITKDKDTLIK